MGLTSSLIIGQSALAASQLALQVTGNNIANVGSPGYHRQTVNLAPVRGGAISNTIYVGRGVNVTDVRRAIDPALQTRVRNSLANEQSAVIGRNVLAEVETILNELSGSDLSSEMGKFFNAFSELANNPASTVNQGTVIEQGAALASFMRGLRTDLVNVRTQIDSQLSTDVRRADTLLDQIANLNLEVVGAELAGGTDGGLRDQRDELINELSGLMDITVIEQNNGGVDILIGSTPIVLGSSSRGLTFDLRTVDGALEARILVKSTSEPLRIESGSIGGRLAQREGAIEQTIDDLDRLASNLILEVNKHHVSGKPAKRLTDLSAWQHIAPADQSRALNDPANESIANLPFAPKNGSFQVVITDASGHESVTTINVDLDGIDNTGVAGFGDDTSLDDLVTALNAIPNLNASITPEGKLRLTSNTGYDVSFKDDSSDVLAILGMNTYFQGVDATNIDIRPELRADPLGLTVGRGSGTNETALAIAALRSNPVASLGNDSLSDAWLKTVERNAVQTTFAETKFLSAATVRSSLEAQYAGVSGVSLDEESINLINYQQSYQGAARFISVVNELTQVLLNLV